MLILSQALIERVNILTIKLNLYNKIETTDANGVSFPRLLFKYIKIETLNWESIID